MTEKEWKLVLFALFRLNFATAVSNYFDYDDENLKLVEIKDQKRIDLEQSFFGKRVIYVSNFGVVSFTPINSSDVRIPSSPKDIQIFVPYFRPDFRTVRLGVKETQDKMLMSVLKKEVRQFSPGLSAVSAVIMNFQQVTNSHGNTNDFQVVLVSAGSEDFMIINYKNLSSAHALSGYSIKNDCKYDVFKPPAHSKHLMMSGNTNTSGRHIIHLSYRGCLHQPRYENSLQKPSLFQNVNRITMRKKLEEGIPFIDNNACSELFISKYGVLSCNVLEKPFFQKQYNFLYINYIEIIASSANATINYKAISDDKWKDRCGTQVSKFISSFFRPEVIIFTEIALNETHGIKLILCSDFNNTYLVVNRKVNFQRNFTFGYSRKSCNWSNSESEERWGNTGFFGEYIFRITNRACNENATLSSRSPFTGFPSVTLTETIISFPTTSSVKEKDEEEDKVEKEGSSSKTIKNYGIIIGVGVAISTIFIICTLALVIYSRRSKREEPTNAAVSMNSSLKKNGVLSTVTT